MIAVYTKQNKKPQTINVWGFAFKSLNLSLLTFNASSRLRARHAVSRLTSHVLSYLPIKSILSIANGNTHLGELVTDTVGGFKVLASLSFKAHG